MSARWIVFLVFLALPGTAMGQGKSFTLSAPLELQENGFLRHLLPRFSLKTGIRISVLGPGADADVSLGDAGRPVIQAGTSVWSLEHDGSEHPARFEDWLTSDVGKRTIAGFPGGAYAAYEGAARDNEVAEITGNASLGEALSLRRCGRCHVVGERNKMNAIGSTPSFALLRTFANWQNRFETFFLRRPHPAFTQVPDVTDAFDPTRPSPIVPLEITLDELDAIIAYVAGVDPADLGAPIQFQ